MKRFATISLAVMLCIGLIAGCSSVTVGSFSSKYLESDDHQDAVNDVIGYFDSLKGCTLERIDYAGDSAVKAEADVRGIAPERVIILEATFTTNSDSRDDGLESDHKYEHYRFVLVRETTGTPWEIVSHGIQ